MGTTNRPSLRAFSWIAASTVCVCALAWLCRGLYIHHRDDLKFVNFLAAWIPFVLSLLVAFVPESKMSTLKKILWRTVVIVVGFVWSVVLWQQQLLTEKTATADQERIVKTAIAKSNEHSDQQIDVVRSDVQGVKTEMQGVKKDLATQISDTVSQSTSRLSESIGKVNKPIPPELARLQFTFWSADPNLASLIPIKETTLQLHQESVSVEFAVGNVGKVPAEDGELWIRICQECRFAKEPEGFDHLKGMPDQDRHRTFQRLLPGVYLEKMTAEIIPPPIGNRFAIDLFYGCKNCEVATKPGPNKDTFFVNVVRPILMQPQ
jgi:hypothetical protein